jgi:hypothetical protein
MPPSAGLIGCRVDSFDDRVRIGVVADPHLLVEDGDFAVVGLHGRYQRRDGQGLKVDAGDDVAQSVHRRPD